ncbi:hypothetical protein [Haloferax volcanii]|uniref:hypothetical protein n=1 Tax=Haloferax volcanii TaxID=2246 RepID=UPI003D3029C1
MIEEYDELERLSHQEDAQREWWDNYGEDLSRDEEDDLFEWAASDKFAYQSLIISLTVDSPESVEDFVYCLNRCSPIVDGDLTWYQLLDAFDDRVDWSPEFAEDLYHQLPVRAEDWPMLFIGTVIKHLSTDRRTEEILRLLRSRDQKQLDIALRGISWVGEQVDPKIVEEIIELGDDDEYALQVVTACVPLFKKYDQCWELVVDISTRNPEIVQTIIDRYGREIESRHLGDYLSVLRSGFEAGEVGDLQRQLHHLYSDFSDEVSLLADFACFLSQYQTYSAKKLVEEIGQINAGILQELVDNVDSFDSEWLASEIIFSAGENRPEDLVEVVVEHFENDRQYMWITVLKKATGELFFSQQYPRDTAVLIANLLENLSDCGFIQPIRWSLINDTPNASEEESHNKEVFYHLHTALSS